MKELTQKAYAKINLGLDVVRRLENGYHEVKMIMQTVGIYDELIFFKKEEGITISTDAGELPTDGDNLIYKAARILLDSCGVQGGVHVHLKKRIPIAAGMAGGSSDAAATLRGVNELYGLGCTTEELQKLGVKIGADVPYCIVGGTVLAEGIGEKLTVLPPAPQCIVLVAKPAISVSTKYVYEHLDAAGLTQHPDIDGMCAAIEQNDLQGVLERMENVLETVTVQAHPVIAEIKERMLELGACKSLMSGSGPTVFGIFDNQETARAAYEKIREEGQAPEVFLTTLIQDINL